jgi:hypothetical protein
MLRRMAARLGVHVALLAGAAVVAAPLLLIGTWHLSHEEVRYLVLVDLFSRALRDGIAYPRFLPDLHGGYGYPTFCFYQPGFFWLAAPFAALPIALHRALQLALVFLLYAGALGAFRLGEQLANRRYGLFGAALFLLTPYLFVDLYVRGDLSETMGLLLGPWGFVGLIDLERRLARGAAPAPAMLGLAASVAALVLAHPAPPIALLPALAATAVALAWGAPHGRAFALRAGASLVAGIALAAPWWAALLALRGSVGFGRLVGGFYTPESHGAAAWQLVARTWGFGGSTAGAADDGMSLQLGAVHLALAVGGALAGRRSRVVAAAAAAYALLVLLVLDVASPFWAHAGPLRFLQFPWRLLAATATLQLVLALGLRAWTASLPPRSEGALLAGIALIALGWHAGQFAIAGATGDPTEILRDYHARVKRQSFEHFAFRDEFTPLAAKRRPDRPRDFDAPAVRLEGPGRVRSLPGASLHRLRVELELDAAGAARLEQLYLPGWKVALDGREIPREALERSLTPEGFVRVALPPGRHRLEAAYGGPPGAGARAAGMLAALGVFAALLRPPRGPLAPAGGGASVPGHSTTKRFGEPSGWGKLASSRHGARARSAAVTSQRSRGAARIASPGAAIR